MKFLNLFRMSENDDLEYAEQLFGSLSVGMEITNQKAKLFLAHHTDRQEILDESINFAKHYSSPRAKFIVAEAYAWSRVSHRKETIKYINDYLSGEPYIEKAKHTFYSFTLDKEKAFQESLAIQQSQMYSYLGKAYEGEYMFDDALNAYIKAYKLDPRNYVCNLLPICKVYSKMGNLDKSIELLKSHTFENVEPYRLKQEKSVCQSSLEKYQKMKKEGYVYKPRKKNKGREKN